MACTSHSASEFSLVFRDGSKDSRVSEIITILGPPVSLGKGIAAPLNNGVSKYPSSRAKAN